MTPVGVTDPSPLELRVAELEELLGFCVGELESMLKPGEDGKQHDPDCVGIYGCPCKAWCTGAETLRRVRAALTPQPEETPE